MVMSMVAGNQNRKRDHHERRDQAASPPSIFLLRGILQTLDAMFEAPHRVVILTWCTN
jgi:hypothetical protein